MHSRRRHRSVHQQRWTVRAVCAVAIGGCVALGVWRPPAPVDVDRLAQVQDYRVCIAIDAIMALAYQGVSPPIDASPEEMAAVRTVNAELAQLREQVRGLPSVREMGC